MTQERNKRFRTALVVCAAAVLMVVGSTVAYLSSRDQATNRFVAGRFDIILTETKWKPTAADNVLPGDELPKNPQVTNRELTPGYIFCRVTVPADRAVDNDDGTPLTPAVNVPMYKFMVSDEGDPPAYSADMTNSSAQSVRSQWIPVGSAVYNGTDKTFVYVYAYSTDGAALTPLQKGQRTEPLFDKLLVWKFSEKADTDRDCGVLVEAFGIQSDLPVYSADQVSEIWALLSGGGGG